MEAEYVIKTVGLPWQTTETVENSINLGTVLPNHSQSAEFMVMNLSDQTETFKIKLDGPAALADEIKHLPPSQTPIRRASGRISLPLRGIRPSRYPGRNACLMCA